MARAQAQDILMNMRFHVNAVGVGGVRRLAAPKRPDAGFSSCNVPSITTESATYREGTFVYSQKYPGVPTVADITLTRGVVRGDSSFWDWMRTVVEGGAEYRADLQILHFHRDAFLTRGEPAKGIANLTVINPDKTQPARIYHVFEAYPSTHKVAGDLEANSNDISMMELGISFESYEIEEVQAG